MAFSFLKTGPLIDGELELVQPSTRWIEAMLHTCALPESASDPAAATVTRARLLEFLREAPHGLQVGDQGRWLAPTYHFWMRILPRPGGPPVEMAGGLNLRVGHSDDLELYIGHVGYGVYPPARGHHYAERATRLLFPLARAHGMRWLCITANPDNAASRRTIERLGGHFIDILDVPADHLLHKRGEVRKVRYHVKL